MTLMEENGKPALGDHVVERVAEGGVVRVEAVRWVEL
jgi:hypothetical protein